MPCLNENHKPFTPLFVRIYCGGGEAIAAVKAMTDFNGRLSVRDALIANACGVMAACKAFMAATQTTICLERVAVADHFQLRAVRVTRDVQPDAAGVPRDHRITKHLELAAFPGSTSNDATLARAAVRRLAQFFNGEVADDDWKVIRDEVESEENETQALVAAAT